MSSYGSFILVTHPVYLLAPISTHCHVRFACAMLSSHRIRLSLYDAVIKVLRMRKQDSGDYNQDSAISQQTLCDLS